MSSQIQKFACSQLETRWWSLLLTSISLFQRVVCKGNRPCWRSGRLEQLAYAAGKSLSHSVSTNCMSPVRRHCLHCGLFDITLLPTNMLFTVFRATVILKLPFRLTTTADQDRFEAFHRRLTTLGFQSFNASWISHFWFGWSVSQPIPLYSWTPKTLV